MEAFEHFTDEQVLAQGMDNNETAQDYLINKYKSFVKIKARQYFIVGADKEDIIQEGMIGLYKAIRDFNPEKQVSFYTFADMCITRQIITAIKAATRQKHIPLNSYISLNKSVFDDDCEKTYIDTLVESRISSPEELFIGREEKKYIESHMGEALSELECRVLSLHLQGKSYSQIGVIVNKNEKAIDNALQRVRRKVEKILDSKNLTSNTVYDRI